MDVRIIGCGNAFSNKNYNQCFLVSENGRNMLIDCGYQIQAALQAANINIRDIHDIYISHLHSDHIGSLEFVALSRYDWLNGPKSFDEVPKPYAPRLIGDLKLLKDLWNHSLRGGLSTIEGFNASLETFFEPVRIRKGQSFQWEGWTCRLIRQVHVEGIMYTYGLMMSKPGRKTVYFTTDTLYDSIGQIDEYYEEADIIFQDCEITPLFTGVHANYVELAGLVKNQKRKLKDNIKGKMYLCHYQDFYNLKQKMCCNSSPHDFYHNSSDKKNIGPKCVSFDWDKRAKKDGFRHFVKLGETFTF